MHLPASSEPHPCPQSSPICSSAAGVLTTSPTRGSLSSAHPAKFMLAGEKTGHSWEQRRWAQLWGCTGIPEDTELRGKVWRLFSTAQRQPHMGRLRLPRPPPPLDSSTSLLEGTVSSIFGASQSGDPERGDHSAEQVKLNSGNTVMIFQRLLGTWWAAIRN